MTKFRQMKLACAPCCLKHCFVWALCSKASSSWGTPNHLSMLCILAPGHSAGKWIMGQELFLFKTVEFLLGSTGITPVQPKASFGPGIAIERCCCIRAQPPQAVTASALSCLRSTASTPGTPRRWNHKVVKKWEICSIWGSPVSLTGSSSNKYTP